MEHTNLLECVDHYYSEKLKKFGVTPNGVDWNNIEGQFLRFRQLSKILSKSQDFSICDFGCGYGAFLDFLSMQYKDFNYIGVDISKDMINAALDMHKSKPNAVFVTKLDPNIIVDFVVASGIFNVKLKCSNDAWYEYIKSTLDILYSKSRIGFSFNCLTKYSDESKKRNDLYYADPCILFDLCKKMYANNVSLLHDYGLYEFTILVRKEI